MPDDTGDDIIMDDLIERVAAELRRPVPPSAALDAWMAELHAAPQRRRGMVTPVLAWLRRPRTVRLSPLGALGIAAAAALLVVLARALVVGRDASSHMATLATTAPAAGQSGPVIAAAGHDGTEMVRFVFLAPHAHTVALAGDFNNWSVGHTMMRRVSRSGLWTVDVPLRPGRYTYTFVVDGTRWLPDPAAPREIGDDFGAPSSVLAIMEKGQT